MRKRDAADGAVDSWTEAVAALYTETPTAAARDQLRYVVDVREHFYVPRFHLSAHVVALSRESAITAQRLYDLRSLATASAKYVTPGDRTIGRLIGASGLLGGLGNVSPPILATLLELLLETGRAHWRSLDDAALQYLPIDNARIAWRVDDDGRQRPHLVDNPQSVLIASSPLWYVDRKRRTAGPADVGLPQIAALIANAPAMTEEQARRTQMALGHIFTSHGVEGPEVTADVRIIDRDPVPLLTLSADDSENAAYVEIRFAYGDRVVTPNEDAREFHNGSGDAETTWPRRTVFEKNAVTRLIEFGFFAVPRAGRTLLRLGSEDENRWVQFIGNVVPRLRAEGWRIEIDEQFPYAIVETGDDWYGELTETEQRWFELELGIDVDGVRVPLLPIIIDALVRNRIDTADLGGLAASTDPIFGRLPNGGYVALPPHRVARVLATLADVFDGESLSENGRVQISPLQAALVAGLDGAVNLDWTSAQSLQTLVAALTEAERKTVDVPPSFHAELRPYQTGGVAWLQTLREHGFGGVLADDMGLCKTVQLLAHVAIEKAAGRLNYPVLIVAPTSVVPNWRSEIGRFVPELRVVSLTGPDRMTRFSQIADSDIALTTYALLPRDAEHFFERRWSIAVIDEAQAVKNPRTRASTAIRQLQVEQPIALTGTPVENHLEELWSIFSFAVPGLLGERSRFARLFRTPIEKHRDSLKQSALATRLRPFLLRRTKEHVASDLPEKTEIVQRVELAGAQRDLYETIRLAMHKRVRDEVGRRGLARSRIVVLDALLKLRQVCCDPRLLKISAAQGVDESQKLEALLEMLESLIEDGRRVLLFSQFTSMLDLIKPELAKRQFSFVELRGNTRDRETPVKRFQNREVPLFLISLKAGGTGLNLTAADTVIHYDPWWNPAVERQATDRAHRIGQEQHVFVYKLIAEGTVEERILELQERKGALAESLFDETSSAPLRLDADDIERLFT